MRQLYSVCIQLYGLALLLISPFHSKAKQMIAGRKYWRKDLTKKLMTIGENRIWFHCASLGEFEQARPIIEAIKENNSDTEIILTFFSPSGYEIGKSCELASAVSYLPLDSKINAIDFLNVVKPVKAYFIKYEFWFNFMTAISCKNIPLYFVSSTFRREQLFFQWYGGWFRQQLNNVTHFFVQNQKSFELLQSNGIDNCTKSGDTRFDRVIKTPASANRNEILESFCGSDPTLILGSSWHSEEKMLAEFLATEECNFKIIIAPHDVSRRHIEFIQGLISLESTLYCETNPNRVKNFQLLIMDCIGLLADAYQYGQLAFVGGGFSNALHNVLEPATFGLPVLYGNNHDKYPEGFDLASTGGGIRIGNQAEFNSVLKRLLSDKSAMQVAGQAARKFITDRIGATEIILDLT